MPRAAIGNDKNVRSESVNTAAWACVKARGNFVDAKALFRRISLAVIGGKGARKKMLFERHIVSILRFFIKLNLIPECFWRYVELTTTIKIDCAQKLRFHFMIYRSSIGEFLEAQKIWNQKRKKQLKRNWNWKMIRLWSIRYEMLYGTMSWFSEMRIEVVLGIWRNVRQNRKSFVVWNISGRRLGLISQ